METGARMTPCFPISALFASRPLVMGEVLGIVYRVIATHLIRLIWTRPMSHFV
jgi:hypothetical protein